MQNCTYMRYQLVLLDIRSHLEQAQTLRCTSQKPFPYMLFFFTVSWAKQQRKKTWPFLQMANPLWQFNAEGKNTTLPTLKDTTSRTERTLHILTPPLSSSSTWRKTRPNITWKFTQFAAWVAQHSHDFQLASCPRLVTLTDDSAFQTRYW